MGYIIGGGTNYGRKQLLQKKTVREEAEKKKLQNRLNRIAGQIAGISRMVEEDRYCDDILIQLSAVNKSIKSLANHIVENHMYRCVLSDIEKGHYEIIEEVVNLFKRFQ